MDEGHSVETDWSVSPEPVLRRLLPALQRGPMLYAAPDERTLPDWLVAEGFEAADAAAFRHVLGSAATSGAGAQAPDDDAGEPRDGDRAAPLGLWLALVVIDGVLSFLSPSEGDALIARARRATRPGGVVYAAAYNVDEPASRGLSGTTGPKVGAAGRSTAAVERPPATAGFASAAGLSRAATGSTAPAAGIAAAAERAAGRAAPQRYLMPGELAMAFEGWILLHATDGPRVERGGRARWVSVVAARRPSSGALLV